MTTLADTPSVRKVKDRSAANLARKRWSKLTAEQRKAQMVSAHQARREKAAARRAAAAQQEPEVVEA